MKTNFHADDYALTINTSKDILECMQLGVLDSISIIPNMPCFDECMEMLIAAIPGMPFLPRMNIHLDLVEGEGIPEDFSWSRLFMYSYLPGKRRKVYRELVSILEKQIDRGQHAIEMCIETAKRNNVRCKEQGMRIDSHQYTHLIPIVWQALMQVLGEKRYHPNYIRCAAEPLSVFLTEPQLLFTYRPINLVKNLILNVYSVKADRYLRDNGLQRMYLWGILMSGRMDIFRVKRLFPAFRKKAGMDGRDLEILFHPGRATAKELDYEAFYLSSHRSEEKKALIMLSRKSRGEYSLI